MTSNYSIFRGKCKEACEALHAVLPELRMVRGYYDGQPHWWLKTPEGNIVDPTALQFTIANIPDLYEEFDGYVACAECGEPTKESEAVIDGNYACCSTRCMMRLVGLT